MQEPQQEQQLHSRNIFQRPSTDSLNSENLRRSSSSNPSRASASNRAQCIPLGGVYDSERKMLAMLVGVGTIFLITLGLLLYFRPNVDELLQTNKQLERRIQILTQDSKGNMGSCNVQPYLFEIEALKNQIKELHRSNDILETRFRNECKLSPDIGHVDQNAIIRQKMELIASLNAQLADARRVIQEKEGKTEGKGLKYVVVDVGENKLDNQIDRVLGL